MIYFTGYVNCKSIKMSSLYFYKLIGKTEELEGRKYLVVDHCMVDKVLDRIKEIIDIEKLDNTKNLINTEDKLSDDITLKTVLILMTCDIKDGKKISSTDIFRSCIIWWINTTQIM